MSQPEGVTAPPGGYRILKIAPTSFFSDYGCHVRIYEESKALERLGNRVTICTYHAGRNLPGLDIRRGLGRSWSNSPVRIASTLRRLYYDSFLALKAHEVALRFKPDIIHAHLHEGAAIGYTLSQVHRVPLVFDFQGSLTAEMLDHHFLRRGSPFYPPLRRLESLVNHLADVVITSSHHAAALLVAQFGYPAHKVMTLEDGVDTETFRPRWLFPEADRIVARLRQEFGVPAGRKVVMYLGLLAEYQGTSKLLGAARILKERGMPVHFLIMGFPGHEFYAAFAAQMGLEGWVSFPGRIPYEKAPQCLLLGDIAVSPKMSETEGNGKLLNYMAAGVPTVAFDTPVAHEFLGPLGVYAAYGSEESLAEAIAGLLSDEREAEARGRSLRQRAETLFTWEQGGRRLVALYDRLRAKTPRKKTASWRR